MSRDNGNMVEAGCPDSIYTTHVHLSVRTGSVMKHGGGSILFLNVAMRYLVNQVH